MEYKEDIKELKEGIIMLTALYKDLDKRIRGMEKRSEVRGVWKDPYPKFGPPPREVQERIRDWVKKDDDISCYNCSKTTCFNRYNSGYIGDKKECFVKR